MAASISVLKCPLLARLDRSLRRRKMSGPVLRLKRKSKSRARSDALDPGRAKTFGGAQ
jgi:hypothetical protein